MFAVVVRMEIDPAAFPDFMPLMTENAQASKLHEPGCHRFDVATDAQRPNEVFLYELYSSPEAFAAHLETEHFKRFDDSVASMVLKKEVTTFDKVIT